ncbi:MAG: PilZ domain-containing protein, partial [Minicystis sp.]
MGGSPRVHFEALVAVGESAGGGFEAESVDVSPDGMRLRTAYLPEIGDRLLCRFDGLGTEVVAEGEVAWRSPEARGGEFGLRFVGLDAATAEAVRAMCSDLDQGPAEASPEEAPAVHRGARVRLHIEGLGSPMKARVREAGSKEIEVGSNLEFLKVGRSLEVEDVDQGVRREAMIEHVKVDVDPTTFVPQLVVSLRYDRPAAQAPAAPTRASAKSVRPPAGPVSVAAPLTRKAPEAEVEAAPSRASRSGAKKAEAPAAPREEVEAQGEEQELDEGEAKTGMGARAAGAGRAMAGKIGPLFAGMNLRAKGAMAGVMDTIRKRRAERAEVAKAGAPRRTTAPAPGGGLKAEGR